MTNEERLKQEEEWKMYYEPNTLEDRKQAFEDAKKMLPELIKMIENYEKQNAKKQQEAMQIKNSSK